jgi:predicted homoserine dehydrogenase-like protein
MTGFEIKHVMDLPKQFSPDELLRQPRVDYVLGAEPGNGAFVVVHSDQPITQQYMRYFKMGDGPLFLFYTPFHLPTIQLPGTIGRVALFNDAAVAPLGPPVADVVAIAKRNLPAGTTLDGVGGFDCYGVIEDAGVAARDRLLPMGIAGDCRLIRSIPQDQPLTYADIELPPDRLCDRLREEQAAWLNEQSSHRLPGNGVS